MNKHVSSNRFYCILLFLSGFTLYLVLRSDYQTGDALYYANFVKNNSYFSHAHHLLYLPIVSCLNKLITFFLPSWDSILTFQLHNAFWAAITVSCVYFISKRLQLSVSDAVLASLLALFSHGLLKWATIAEAYAPALGCVTLVYSTLLLSKENELSQRRIVLCSVIFSLGILYHQATVLLVFPILYRLISTRTFWKERILFCVYSGALTFTAYLYAYLSIKGYGDERGFYDFIFTYKLFGESSWGSFQNFGSAGLVSLLKSQVLSFLYLSGSTLLLAGILVAITFCLTVMWNLHRMSVHENLTTDRKFLLAWLFVYYPFILWWLPRLHQMLLFVMIPVLFLALLTFEDLLKRRKKNTFTRWGSIIAKSFVIAIFAYANVSWSLSASTSRGSDYASAKALHNSFPRECVFLSTWEIGQNLEYYFDRTTIDFDIFLKQTSAKNQDSGERPLSSECIVVPVSKLSGAKNYTEPVDWLRFLGKLLDLKYQETVSLSSRDFRAVRIRKKKEIYLQILGRRRTHAGVPDLICELDNEISRARGELTKEFQDWYFLHLEGKR